MYATKRDSDREYRDSPVFWFVRPEKARERQEHATAAQAIRELSRLGVNVRFAARPKGAQQR